MADYRTLNAPFGGAGRRTAAPVFHNRSFRELEPTASWRSSPKERLQPNGPATIFRTGRFLRRSILFCDEHPIDLYQLIRALYLVRMKGLEKRMKRAW
jgi:hypothetical protein